MKGSIVHQYGHIIDIMPTFLEIAEATYPVSYKQNDIKPMEGLSILPVLKGEDFTREAPIYWEHEGNRGGRSGKWKIVSFNHKPWTL